MAAMKFVAVRNDFAMQEYFHTRACEGETLAYFDFARDAMRRVRGDPQLHATGFDDAFQSGVVERQIGSRYLEAHGARLPCPKRHALKGQELSHRLRHAGRTPVRIELHGLDAFA